MIADLGQLDLLIALVKHESFVPTQKDFESFVGVCLAKRNHLLLKTFLQAFQVQFVFKSYPVAS